MGEYATPVNTLTVNGTNLYTLAKVYVTGSGTFNTPEKDYEVIEVPGRSGDLILPRNRRKNLTIAYPCFIVEDFENNFNALVSFLYNLDDYAKLQDTYHEFYRIGLFTGPLEPDMGQDLSGGSFNLSFNCKPQRYLPNGDTTATIVTSGGNKYINNPTNSKSRPLISFKGYGQFSVNGTTLTMAEHSDTASQTVYVDCESHETYAANGITLNKFMSLSGDFPYLKPEANLITYANTISNFSIIPRWEV